MKVKLLARHPVRLFFLWFFALAGSHALGVGFLVQGLTLELLLLHFNHLLTQTLDPLLRLLSLGHPNHLLSRHRSRRSICTRHNVRDMAVERTINLGGGSKGGSKMVSIRTGRITSVFPVRRIVEGTVFVAATAYALHEPHPLAGAHLHARRCDAPHPSRHRSPPYGICSSVRHLSSPR